MRLPIIAFVVFAVCFGLFGCTNGDEVSLMEPSLSAIQNDSPKVLLLVTNSKIFASQYSANNGYFSKYQIEDNSTLPKSYEYIVDFTSTCLDNNIYILKTNYTSTIVNYMITKEFKKKKTLEVIHYDENNKFKRIRQVENMFDIATSITSDYKTGKIYWTEYNTKDYEFSIKVTDKSFKEPEYIIYPTNQFFIQKLLVYQDKNILFFISGDGSLWYTLNSTNSTADQILRTNRNPIDDITIDYKTDKLCWIQSFPQQFYLNCAGIRTFGSRLYLMKIVTIEETQKYMGNFVAFDNTFYWITEEDEMPKLYFKNGNKTALKIADLEENGLLSIVPSTCPSTKKLFELIVSEKDTKTDRAGWWPIDPPWPVVV